MAIKINGQDLLKKFIGGQEIARIYKNGGEIRPNTVPPTPPQPDYHIMGDFADSGASGQLPSGWTMTAGSGTAIIDSNGVTSDSNNNQVTLESDNYPNMAWASRIVLEVGFTATNRGAMNSFIKSINSNQFSGFNGFTSTITTFTNGSANNDNTGLAMPYTGTLKTIWNICEGDLELHIDNQNFTHELNGTDINTLRTSTSFETQIAGYTPMTISNIDVYIWEASYIIDRQYSQTTGNVGDTIKVYTRHRAGSGTGRWEASDNMRYISWGVWSGGTYYELELLSSGEGYFKTTSDSGGTYNYDKIYITINS